MYGLGGWEEHRDAIRGLKGRLGFPEEEELELLALRLSLIDGSIYDALRDRRLNPRSSEEGELMGIVYQVLSAYSRGVETPPTGRLITSRQLTGGQICHVMVGRARRLIAETFRDETELQRAARLIGGETIEIGGEKAIRIRPLPRVPITILFRAGDEELPPEASIFYDGNVESYLDLENLGLLTLLTAMRLREAYRRIRERDLLELLLGGRLNSPL